MCHNKTEKKHSNHHLPDELHTIIETLYQPAGFNITEAYREIESTDYKASRFRLNHHLIVFRVAKITPNKIGQFVTLWQRKAGNADIAPFDIEDNIDFIVVSVFDNEYRGQFIFDQKILLKKDIMSRHQQGGKRAIRIYPPWVKPIAKQAIKTQQWQQAYFLPLDKENRTDLALLRQLFQEETI